MGYDAQLINRQFQHATAKNFLRRQTLDKTDRVSFVIRYIPGAEKLCHVLRSLQHLIDDNEHLSKIFLMPLLLAFNQPPNFKHPIVRSKLPSLQDNIDHNIIQTCYGNLCKTCQIIDMDTTITHGNTTHHMHGRYSSDSANVVCLLRCRQGCPEGSVDLYAQIPLSIFLTLLPFYCIIYYCDLTQDDLKPHVFREVTVKGFDPSDYQTIQ
eukprot:g46959.t1